MAGQRITLHLDPVRSAANLITLLDALGRSPEATYPSYGAITARVRQDYEYTDRTEPLYLALQLGLMAKENGVFCLSLLGRTLLGMRPNARADVLHMLLTGAWSRNPDAMLGFSWSYRTFCGRLWEQGTAQLTKPAERAMVADLTAAAADLGAERSSISTKSILGMRRWLAALDPPVIEGDTFRRREVCSPELTLLAVGLAARESGSEVGVDLLLTPERRAAVCRICLLEPAALDRRLDQAIGAFPRLIAPGTRTGPYGRFVRLLVEPNVEALAR